MQTFSNAMAENINLRRNGLRRWVQKKGKAGYYTVFVLLMKTIDDLILGHMNHKTWGKRKQRKWLQALNISLNFSVLSDANSQSIFFPPEFQ